jgi:hypothetical protein
MDQSIDIEMTITWPVETTSVALQLTDLLREKRRYVELKNLKQLIKLFAFAAMHFEILKKRVLWMFQTNIFSL